MAEPLPLPQYNFALATPPEESFKFDRKELVDTINDACKLSDELYSALSKAILSKKHRVRLSWDHSHLNLPADVVQVVNTIRVCVENEEWSLLTNLCMSITNSAAITLPAFNAAAALGFSFYNPMFAIHHAKIALKQDPTQALAYLGLANTTLAFKSKRVRRWLSLAVLAQRGMPKRYFNYVNTFAKWNEDREKNVVDRILSRLSQYEDLADADLKSASLDPSKYEKVTKFVENCRKDRASWPEPWESGATAVSFSEWSSVAKLYLPFNIPITLEMRQQASPLERLDTATFTILAEYLDANDMAKLSMTCPILYSWSNESMVWSSVSKHFGSPLVHAHSYVKRPYSTINSYLEGLDPTVWDYYKYCTRIQAVVNAMQEWTFVLEDHSDSVVPEELDERVRTTLTRGLYTAYPTVEQRGGFAVCSHFIRLIQSDGSGNLAHWFAHNTRVVDIVLDVCSRCALSYDWAPYKVLNALTILFLNNPDIRARYRALGLETLFKNQPIDMGQPYGSLTLLQTTVLIVLLQPQLVLPEKRFIVTVPERELKVAMRPQDWQLARQRWNTYIWQEIIAFPDTHVLSHQVHRGIFHFEGPVDEVDSPMPLAIEEGKRTFGGYGIDTIHGEYTVENGTVELGELGAFSFTKRYKSGQTVDVIGFSTQFGFSGNTDLDIDGQPIQKAYKDKKLASRPGVWQYAMGSTEYTDEIWKTWKEQIVQETLDRENTEVEKDPIIKKLLGTQNMIDNLNQLSQSANLAFAFSIPTVSMNILTQMEQNNPDAGPQLEDFISQLTGRAKIFRGPTESAKKYKLRCMQHARLMSDLMVQRFFVARQFQEHTTADIEVLSNYKDFDLLHATDIPLDLATVIHRWSMIIQLSVWEFYGQEMSVTSLKTFLELVRGDPQGDNTTIADVFAVLRPRFDTRHHFMYADVLWSLQDQVTKEEEAIQEELDAESDEEDEEDDDDDSSMSLIRNIAIGGALGIICVAAFAGAFVLGKRRAER